MCEMDLRSRQDVFLHPTQGSRALWIIRHYDRRTILLKFEYLIYLKRVHAETMDLVKTGLSFSENVTLHSGSLMSCFALGTLKVFLLWLHYCHFPKTQS